MKGMTPARLYVAQPPGDDDAGTVFVRTELPAPAPSAQCTIAAMFSRN